MTMATISFDRPVTVNSDWGVKNLEHALDKANDLSSMYDKYSPCKKATKEDVRNFIRNYKK